MKPRQLELSYLAFVSPNGPWITGNSPKMVLHLGLTPSKDPDIGPLLNWLRSGSEVTVKITDVENPIEFKVVGLSQKNDLMIVCRDNDDAKVILKSLKFNVENLGGSIKREH